MINTTLILIIVAASFAVSMTTRVLILNHFGALIAENGGGKAPNKTSAARARFFRSVQRLGSLRPVQAKDARSYRDRLAQAGLHIDLSTWRGIQVVSAGIGVLFGVAMITSQLDAAHIFLGAIICFLGIAGPNLVLTSLVRDRKNKIKSTLASTLELLSITVKSGYPLERGLRLVGQTAQGPLADEFRQVDTDVNLLGMSLERALKRMSKRCDTPAVSSFTTALIQAAKQGTSVSRVLDAQARIARNEHYADLQEKVNKLPAKLVVPIFGIMMLIIVIALVPPVYDTVLLFTSAYGGYESSGGTSALGL